MRRIKVDFVEFILRTIAILLVIMLALVVVCVGRKAFAAQCPTPDAALWYWLVTGEDE